jgi:UDP-glucose 4-epimerase
MAAPVPVSVPVRCARFDESMATKPTSTFGRILAGVEQQATTFAAAAGVPIASVRLAPVIGAHIPSPLGRLLRLPAVPFGPTRRARFSVIDLDDAADALVGAARLSIDGPVNVAGAGSISPLAAIKIGSRLPVPVVGPGWWPARHVAGVVGAPVPDHVVELLQHGRLAVTDRARLLGLDPARSTVDALRALYAWPAVTHLRATATAGAGGAASPFADAARPVSLRIVHG